MSVSRHEATRLAYEHPEIVQGYTAEYSLDPKMLPVIDRFAESIRGSRLIDIGCGPGHHAHRFAELGFDVDGLDYSSRMVETAQALRPGQQAPQFHVGDVRDLTKLFPENTFDAAWANASLLHIPEEELPAVLHGITTIVKPQGKVFISLRKGQGRRIIKEEKYGTPIEREYMYWERNSLDPLLDQAGLKVEDVGEDSGITNGMPVTWMQLFLEVTK